MVIAIMHSESFEWIALGNDYKDAGQALLDKWNKDQINLSNFYGFEPNTYETVDDLTEYYGVTFIKLDSGECCQW